MRGNNIFCYTLCCFIAQINIRRTVDTFVFSVNEICKNNYETTSQTDIIIYHLDCKCCTATCANRLNVCLEIPNNVDWNLHHRPREFFVHPFRRTFFAHRRKFQTKLQSEKPKGKRRSVSLLLLLQLMSVVQYTEVDKSYQRR